MLENLTKENITNEKTALEDLLTFRNKQEKEEKKKRETEERRLKEIEKKEQEKRIDEHPSLFRKAQEKNESTIFFPFTAQEEIIFLLNDPECICSNEIAKEFTASIRKKKVEKYLEKIVHLFENNDKNKNDKEEYLPSQKVEEHLKPLYTFLAFPTLPYFQREIETTKTVENPHYRIPCFASAMGGGYPEHIKKKYITQKVTNEEIYIDDRFIIFITNKITSIRKHTNIIPINIIDKKVYSHLEYFFKIKENEELMVHYNDAYCKK